MTLRSFGLCGLLLAACSEGGSSEMHTDARPIPDAHDQIDGSSQVPYRHAIALDGVDDFALVDQFATTSASFEARVTWDEKNIYVGYSGPDLMTSTSDANTKWLFVYLDTKPGGEAQSELYNTQRATFP
ncbi:MAG TPA: hypothetical protein VFV99_30750, partial [Kofleriaceae bacterium]|nr:hypothetical protein [Kofleriaceae bacterium]